MDRCRQAGVRHEREAVLALELERDGLDDGVLLERVLDLRADRLHQLEEVLRLDLLVMDEQEIGEDVIVAFVQLVEIQSRAPGAWEMGPQNTPGSRSGRS